MLPDDLSLRYQPIVSATTGRLLAVEALLRRDDQTAAPLALLADAAESGYADRLDRTVLEWACAQMRAWRGQGLHLPIHVNVSVATATSTAAPRFASWLSQLPVPRGALTIELTETTRISGIRDLLRFVETCRAAGFEVALDDFGCGYSTLRLLQRFRSDAVKLDRRFIAALPDDACTRTIVRHMIALAHDLGMRVIGEGVETPAQAEWLRRLECDEIQGYAIARPMTGEGIARWAADRAEPPASADGCA
jgi:EAL domain-containing protein (putative c-di-GMP-specific phosphodiesterase class I)